MKKKEFTCTNIVPELNEQENKLFFLNVEFAVLMSLVKRGLLTRSQAEQCKNRLTKSGQV
ncbi:MAG: hypothetical protein K2H82_02020 [Oscillospiraceae bacterium]|nr:hypothetical protein [Oscillospiraceae bacterium]